MWEERGRMDLANLGLPCLLGTTFSNWQCKGGVRMPHLTNFVPWLKKFAHANFFVWHDVPQTKTFLSHYNLAKESSSRCNSLEVMYPLPIMSSLRPMGLTLSRQAVSGPLLTFPVMHAKWSHCCCKSLSIVHTFEDPPGCWHLFAAIGGFFEDDHNFQPFFPPLPLDECKMKSHKTWCHCY